MALIIISELISIVGTFIGVLIIRYMLRLSSPALDLYLLRHFYYGLVATWKSGQFEQVKHAYIAKKLLDY